MDRLHFLEEWHNLEVYPGQWLFRWTTGPSAKVIWFPSANRPSVLGSPYRVPAGAIELQIDGHKVAFHDEVQSEGWHQSNADVGTFTNAGNLNVEIISPEVFHFPPYKRQFGCMVVQILID